MAQRLHTEKLRRQSQLFAPTIWGGQSQINGGDVH